MQIIRMFSNEKYKGKKGYLDSQKIYEVMRTILYFGISISLFAAGWITTGSRLNLLTVVAVLGCLPASKSAVEMIMYLRYHSCPDDAADAIDRSIGNLNGMYDMVFTTYQKNYYIAHLTVKGNTICGYTGQTGFDENGFYKHIGEVLKMDGYSNITVKIFTDLKKYTNRLSQLQELDCADSGTEGIAAVLKSISL